MQQRGAPLNFDAVEHELNLDNLQEMALEIPERSERLATRITHFSMQFDIPEEAFWEALEADPNGPLAAVLAREARRQRVHESAAAEYVGGLQHVENFLRLPFAGRHTLYINPDGQLITKGQLGAAPQPSEAIDFMWQTGGVICYAAQKYTREGGGNQGSRFDETLRLLENFQNHRDRNSALFVLVDGPYFDVARMERLGALVRIEPPRSYISSINELQQILNQLVDAGLQ